MLSHEKIWAAIDALATQNGLSTSGLARRAGLDPTTFNRSKRIAGDSRPRWPSTESLAKILEVTGEELLVFAARLETSARDDFPKTPSVPVTGFSDVASEQAFDASGCPTGNSWSTFTYPNHPSKGEFALEISGDDLLPLYRHGDIIIAAPNLPKRNGDRILVKPKGTQLVVYTLARRMRSCFEFLTIGDNPKTVSVKHSAIEWTARIIWASQ